MARKFQTKRYNLEVQRQRCTPGRLEIDQRDDGSTYVITQGDPAIMKLNARGKPPRAINPESSLYTQLMTLAEKEFRSK